MRMYNVCPRSHWRRLFKVLGHGVCTVYVYNAVA